MRIARWLLVLILCCTPIQAQDNVPPELETRLALVQPVTQ